MTIAIAELKCYLCGEEDNPLCTGDRVNAELRLLDRYSKETTVIVCEDFEACLLRKERRLRAGIGQEEIRRMINGGAIC